MGYVSHIGFQIFVLSELLFMKPISKEIKINKIYDSDNDREIQIKFWIKL